MEVCPYCLQKFTTQEKLDMHKIDCINHTAVRIECTEKEKLEFTNHQKQIKNPFVIYADFESTLEKIDTCQPNPSEPFSNQIQKHPPNCFCVYTKYEVDEYSKLEIYTGPNSAEEFLKYLESEVHRIYQSQKINKNMYLPPIIYKNT